MLWCKNARFLGQREFKNDKRVRKIMKCVKAASEMRADFYGRTVDPDDGAVSRPQEEASECGDTVLVRRLLLFCIVNLDKYKKHFIFALQIQVASAILVKMFEELCFWS